MAAAKIKKKAPLVVVRRVDGNGNVTYMNKSRLHREDGPAREFSNGDKEWWVDGLLHRVDGPAIDRVNGQQFWYIKGLLHREDGPAAIYPNSSATHYLNGRSIEVNEFNKFVRDSRRLKALDALEKFADGCGSSEAANKAGEAAIKFLRGECDHSFKKNENECALCD